MSSPLLLLLVVGILSGFSDSIGAAGYDTITGAADNDGDDGDGEEEDTAGMALKLNCWPDQKWRGGGGSSSSSSSASSSSWREPLVAAGAGAATAVLAAWLPSKPKWPLPSVDEEDVDGVGESGAGLGRHSDAEEATEDGRCCLQMLDCWKKEGLLQVVPATTTAKKNRVMIHRFLL